MAFANRVRLPFYLSRPQFPADEDIYLKANGTRRVLKSIISKELEGSTDWLPAKIHERLAIALRHDTVNIEGTKYVGSVRINGSYEIGWVDFLDFPLAPAKFKALEEAFAARNTRCDICTDDVLQMNLRDDYFPNVLNEGSTTEIDAAANDSICCNDPVFSIYSYDSNYVDSVVINAATGLAGMTLKTPLPSTGTIQLFQYKVTCGTQEATATVYGAISGSSSVACAAPSNLLLSFVDPASNPVELLASWTAPGSPPADGYGWMLTSDNGIEETVIGSGTTTSTSVNINSLPYNTLLRFRVWSICDVDLGDTSATIMDIITTPDEPACTNEHLVLANYDADENITISGTCIIDSITVTRTSIATTDATCNNKCLSVIVRIEMDNGCVIFEGFDFNPTDNSSTLTNIEASCGGTPCTSLVSATIYNILEISC